MHAVVGSGFENEPMVPLLVFFLAIRLQLVHIGSELPNSHINALLVHPLPNNAPIATDEGERVQTLFRLTATELTFYRILISILRLPSLYTGP